MFNVYGHYTGPDFPADCVAECSAQGDCYDAVEAWRVRLGFAVPRDQAVAYLRECGAWPVESDAYDIGLNQMTDEDLARKVLWIACGDIAENGDWYGLTH